MTSSRHARTSPTGVALAFRWKGRDRIVVPNRLAVVAALVALPLLAAWSLGSGFYVLFHDQLLASLMSRQADMQYAYEDRIAALRAQLDRETSRGLIDHATLETTVRDLATRGRMLEAHAETMTALVTQGLKSPTLTVSRRTDAPVRFPRLAPAAIDNPLLAPSATLPSDVRAYAPPAATSAPDLRLGAPEADKRADLSSDDLAPAAIASRFAKIDASQAAVVASLREPALRAIARMRTALADTGLSQGRLPGRVPHEDVGGPFVPLPTSGLSFDDGVALLRDAIRQQATLDAMIDKVPLRQPVEGPLDISSTFGARMDPFLGRPAMHTGVDLKETYGDAVAATASGTVTIAGPDGGYGNMVEIDHGNGLATRYAHLSAISVVPHQVVAVGTIVGHVGSTGRSTGPHLHYETRIDGEAVDPTRFLRAGAGLTRG